MLVWVYIAVAIVTYFGLERSWRATVCVLLPLVLVTALADAMMVFLNIGLKVATLPVTALGVGIGVDYGVYIFARFLQLRHEEGLRFRRAYGRALRETGRAVMVTGATLAVSVATWMFSPLRYQADLGIMLTVMFVFSMLGAIVISPALARFLYWREAAEEEREAIGEVRSTEPDQVHSRMKSGIVQESGIDGPLTQSTPVAREMG